MHHNTMEVEIHKLKSEFNTIRYQYKSIEEQLIAIKEIVINQRVEIERLTKDLELATNKVIELENA